MKYDNVIINLHITEGLYFISKKLAFDNYNLFIRFLINKVKMGDINYIVNVFNPVVNDLMYVYGFTSEIAINYITECIVSGFCIKNIGVSLDILKNFGKCFSK